MNDQIRIDRYWHNIAIIGTLMVSSQLLVRADENSVQFRDFLVGAARQFDCYFVVEAVGMPKSLNNPVLDGTIQPHKADSIDALTVYLSQQAEVRWRLERTSLTLHLLADRIDSDKPIIRIRDRRLSDVTNYVLDSKITIAYAGTPDGLLSSLNGTYPALKQQMFFSGTLINMDARTPIVVNVAGVRIAELLSKCIPLEGYSRIIWSSCTDGQSESPNVTVQYWGHRANP